MKGAYLLRKLLRAGHGLRRQFKLCRAPSIGDGCLAYAQVVCPCSIKPLLVGTLQKAMRPFAMVRAKSTDQGRAMVVNAQVRGILRQVDPTPSDGLPERGHCLLQRSQRLAGRQGVLHCKFHADAVHQLSQLIALQGATEFGTHGMQKAAPLRSTLILQEISVDFSSERSRYR